MMLGWSQETLAREAKVSVRRIRDFEAEILHLNSATLQAIRHTLEAAGTEFTNQGASFATRLRGITPDPRKQGYEDEIESDEAD